jgi:hypothetical protein
MHRFRLHQRSDANFDLSDSIGIFLGSIIPKLKHGVFEA